ncbi:hypothetical protein [Bacillus sp. FJAT-42315]|uniref:hypothetical protein n=1 Tax=Bacillus sp. FJAT-42315 TaxID=2014077 RepID=UPI000C249026|nr:hypothetical protein [Bacillus sp. FJAT-42315]
MKKYLLFTGSFVLAYGVLQIVSGLVLTKLYTPDFVWKNASSLPSEVEFGSASSISPLMISLLALGITFCAMKLFKQKLY